MRTFTISFLAAIAAAAIAPRRAHADGTSCVPGFDMAIFGRQSVGLSGNVLVDSYDSTPPGTFATTHVASGGHVGANGCTSPTAVSVSGSVTLHGNVSIGEGCPVAAGYSQSGSPTVTGTKTAQTTNRVLTSVTVPTVGTNQGNKSVSAHGTLNLAPNQTYGSINASGGSHVVFSAGTYVVSSISLSGNSDVQLASTPVLIYVTSSMDITGGTITNPTLRAPNLVFMVAATATSVKVAGGTESSFAVYAPDTNIQISGNAAIYGALVGKQVSNSGTPTIHYDKALGGFSGPFTCSGVTTEVSRSTPVIAYAGSTLSQFQGSYEVVVPTPSAPVLAAGATLAQAQAWTFPHYKGHVRAVPVGSISSSATLLSSVASPVFDAATVIPPATNAWSGTGCSRFSNNCRTVFTNVTGGLRPARTMVQSSNASSIGALVGISLATVRDEMLKRVVGLTSAGVSAPVLGGIDRSSMAVIEANPLSNPYRPVMVYVGGLDGMMHAICASIQGSCTQLGMELWAFIPRTQLGYLKSNNAMVNGTPRVADVYGDFDGDGTDAWRTILTFQTGGGDPTLASMAPAVYALDVTDPTDPRIVWEYTTPSSRGTHELGVGLTLAMGEVKIGGTFRDLTFAQTNNGGTGGGGTSVFALDTATGSVVWRWDYLYPAARSVGVAVPATGIPGGVAGADLQGDGRITELFVGTLYGNLFQLDPATGRSRYGSAPAASPCVAPACVALYQFATDYHPVGAAPTVYTRGGVTYVAVASGGYADNTTAAGAGSNLPWSPTTTSQYLISISVSTSATSTPLSATVAGGPIAIASNLGAGNRVGSQAQVSGDEIFLTTDTLNVGDTTAYGTGASDTGKIFRIALATGSTTSSTDVAGGAGSVDVSAGAAYIASGKSTRTVTAGTAPGAAVETAPEFSAERILWLGN
ncbi:MAG TPA: hypothetical protein VFU21_00850 [Kofleriaceae bacterium]|nr:hypothetical protein [Kofleriaceae bacterium]